MSYAIKGGSTDQIMVFQAFNTDGTAKTDLASGTAGITLSVFRIGAAAVAVGTLSDKAADDTTHADGAVRQVIGNVYTVDVPDAAVATGVPGAMIKGSFTGGTCEGVLHPIVGYDPNADISAILVQARNAALNTQS